MTDASANLTPERLLDLYRKMRRIRIAEEKIGEASHKGEIPGAVHLYIGQEAVAVGVCDGLRESDWITSTHRGHGHFLAKGGSLNAMIAEIYGRATGICGGKGGSMHVADFSRGIVVPTASSAGGSASPPVRRSHASCRGVATSRSASSATSTNRSARSSYCS